MTTLEYKDYESRVKRFFREEKINCLSDKEECVEPYFSHSNCDCCKRSLAGNRYDMTGYSKADDEIYDYEICVDCRYYAEYGQLDDMTMMEVNDGQQQNKNTDGNDNAGGVVWGSEPVRFRT